MITSEDFEQGRGTLETIDGRQALRFQRRLEHRPERVWRAVTEPAELARWFVAVPPWTPAAGESFEAFGQTGTVTELEPPSLIAWEWGVERYSFELLPEAGGEATLLTFIHYFDPAYGPGGQHAAGWESYLLRLSSLLQGEELSEAEAHRIVPELNERYAIALGEDAGPARISFAKHGPLPVDLIDGGEGPQLRFERHYGYPVERLWRAISEPEERAEWFPSDVPFEIAEAEEPTLLIASFHDTRIRFELSPDADGEGCTLVFTHAFPDRDDAAKTAAGWDRCLTRLQALLAGGSYSERQAVEDWPIVHERYAEAFGVGTAAGEAAYEAHPLRN